MLWFPQIKNWKKKILQIADEDYTCALMAMRFYVSPFPLHCTVYKVSRRFGSDDHIFIIIHLTPIKVYIFWKGIVPGI